MVKEILEEAETKSIQVKDGTMRRKVTALIGAVFLIIGGTLAYSFYLDAINHETTDDAFVEAHVVSVSPRISGHVINVQVTDNQQVKKGDLIAEIDPRDFEVTLQIITARMESAQAAVKEADALVVAAQKELAEKEAELSSQAAGLSRVKANVAQAKAGYLRDERDLRRIQSIVNAGAVSRQEFDHAKAQEEMARANLNSVKSQVDTQSAEIIKAQAAVEVAQGKLKQAYAQIDKSKAKLREAEASLEQAKLNLSYTKIVAPCSGYVTKKAVEAGAYLNAGQKMLSVVSTDVWVVANFKETQIMAMHEGQPVDIEVDSYPGVVFKGHVDSLQRGTGSRFTLLPPENASGNFIKVVQRVPVKIALDNSVLNGKYMLVPGMSVLPSVDISAEGLGATYAASSTVQE